MVMQNYDIPRAADSTAFDRNIRVILVGDSGRPFVRTLGDLLDIIAAGDLATGEANNRVLVFQAGSMSWEQIHEDMLLDGAVAAAKIGDGAIDSIRMFGNNAVPIAALASDAIQRLAPDPSGQTVGEVVAINAAQNGYELVSPQSGDDGANATIEIRYQRGTSSSPPSAPSGSNPAGWDAAYTAPDSSNRYVWRAVRSGTVGSLPSTWTVSLASYLAEDGTDGTNGTDGTDGAAGQAYVRYRTTTNANAPAVPTSASDAAWATTRRVVDATNTHEWAAVGVAAGGTTTISWVVWLIAEHDGGSVTPPPATHQRYLAYAATQGYVESELTGGTSITSGDTGALSGATAASYVKIWSAEALTTVTNPVLHNPGESGRSNILTTHFTAASRRQIGLVNGYYYESTTVLAVGVINQTWTIR